MSSKNYRVTEALQQALDLSQKFDEDPSFALQTLRASVQGILTFMSYDGEPEPTSGTQLCATIRRRSQYAHQANHLPADQQFFPVRIRPDVLGYCVAGGPGGQYRLLDVHLYAHHKNQLVKLT